MSPKGTMGSVLTKLEEMRKKREVTEARRKRGSELYQQQLARKGELAKMVISGEDTQDGIPMDVIIARKMYHDCLQSYFQKKLFLTGERLEGSALALWTRVANAQKESGVEPDRFFKAQFDYFHKFVHKPPAPYQLCTKNAIERAQKFAGLSTGNVVGKPTEHKSNLAELFKNTEKMITQIMSAQKLTKIEFYQKLVLTGLVDVPDEYLSRCKVFESLADAG